MRVQVAVPEVKGSGSHKEEWYLSGAWKAGQDVASRTRQRELSTTKV